MTNLGTIKSANKDSSANLKTERIAEVEIDLKDGKMLKIDKVIYANGLKENLLFFRKFVESRLSVYLDND